MSATVTVDDSRFGDKQESLSIVERHKPLDYSETLRVIGQALESLQAETFDIVCHRSSYLVRCLTRKKENKLGDLLNIRRLWKQEIPSPFGSGKGSSMNLELLYTPKDLQLLEELGTARRRIPRGMPDPFSLANILRAVGWFLIRERGCRLLRVSKHGSQVLVVSETSQGVRKAEEYSTFTLYDFWVKMYVKKIRRYHQVSYENVSLQ